MWSEELCLSRLHIYVHSFSIYSACLFWSLHPNIVISVLRCTELLPSRQSLPSDCSMDLLIVPVMKRNCDRATEIILLLVLSVLKSCPQEMRSARMGLPSPWIMVLSPWRILLGRPRCQPVQTTFPNHHHDGTNFAQHLHRSTLSGWLRFRL